MKNKYVSGLVIAIVAMSFAVFIAANNSSDKSSTKVVKNTASSQKVDTSASKSAKADTQTTDQSTTSKTLVSDSTTVSTSSASSMGIPADQYKISGRGASNDVVLAIVTKPAEVAPAPVVEPAAAQPAEVSPTPATPAPTTPAPVTPAPVTPVSGNLVANPSVEESVNNIPTAWTAGGFGVNTATTSYAATGHNATAHSLQVDIAAYTDGDAKWLSSAFPVTVGQTYQVSSFYKSVGTSQVDVGYISGTTTTYAWIGDAAPAADWAAFNGQFTVPAGVTSVFVFHALTSVGSLSTDDYSVVAGGSTTPTPAPVPTPVPAPGVGFTGGRISLTFDDGLQSTYTNGFPLLRDRGLVSTQYWISDTIKNNDNYGGSYMTLAEAQNWLVAIPGTEVAGHTMHHCSLVSATTTDDAVNCLTNLNATEQTAQNNVELNQGKADLQALFPGAAITDFASPYGSYDATSIAQIKAAGYASHRSTDAGFNSFGAFDPYNIMVQNIEATTTVSQVQSWVNQAITTNTWLVLVYHDIDTTAGAFGVTTADFTQHLDFIKASGIKVETVSQALAGN